MVAIIYTCRRLFPRRHTPSCAESSKGTVRCNSRMGRSNQRINCRRTTIRPLCPTNQGSKQATNARSAGGEGRFCGTVSMRSACGGMRWLGRKTKVGAGCNLCCVVPAVCVMPTNCCLTACRIVCCQCIRCLSYHGHCNQSRQ